MYENCQNCPCCECECPCCKNGEYASAPADFRAQMKTDLIKNLNFTKFEEYVREHVLSLLHLCTCSDNLAGSICHGYDETVRQIVNCARELLKNNLMDLPEPDGYLYNEKEKDDEC